MMTDSVNFPAHYYPRLVSFRNALKDEPRAVGLVNLLEDLTQTCNTIIYPLFRIQKATDVILYPDLRRSVRLVLLRALLQER